MKDELSGNFMCTLGFDLRYGGGKVEMFSPLFSYSLSFWSGNISIASGRGVLIGVTVSMVSTMGLHCFCVCEG